MEVTDESQIVRDQRRAAASVNRSLALLAAAAISLFSLTNPYYISTELSVRYVLFSGPLIASLIAYAAFTTRAGFYEAKWSELILLSVATPLILSTSLVLAPTAEQLGWQGHALLFANVTSMMSFATIAFVANFRAYTIWVVGTFIAYLIALSSLKVGPSAVSVHLTGMAPMILLGLYVNWSLNERSRKTLMLSKELRLEKVKTDEMLYSILPQEVAARLRGGEAVADPFSDACVIFLDIVGSSELARMLSPKHFVRTLDTIFTTADSSASKYGIEKVKTIGDAYLAIAGGRTGGEPLQVIQFAMDVIRSVQDLATREGLDINVRVGVHSGPVVGGVIGTTKATYDYWGDTMNIAARVEGAAPVGGISVTKQVYFATRHEISYALPRFVTLKGIGEMPIYDVVEQQGPGSRELTDDPLQATLLGGSQAPRT